MTTLCCCVTAAGVSQSDSEQFGLFSSQDDAGLYFTGGDAHSEVSSGLGSPLSTPPRRSLHDVR